MNMPGSGAVAMETAAILDSAPRSTEMWLWMETAHVRTNPGNMLTSYHLSALQVRHKQLQHDGSTEQRRGPRSRPHSPHGSCCRHHHQLVSLQCRDASVFYLNSTNEILK